MNDRQLFAFGNPIIFGKSQDESVFEQVIIRKGLKIRTKLTVQAPVLHRSAVWNCQGIVIDDNESPVSLSVLNSEQRRILGVVVSELLDNVGVGRRVTTEDGKRMMIYKDLAREEFEELAQILSGDQPLPEIRRVSPR
jgi:hypothetical protein